MPGGIAVAIASGAGRTRFGNAPFRTMLFAHTPREQQGIGFTRGTHADHVLRGDAEQGFARLRGIDDATAEEIG